ELERHGIQTLDEGLDVRQLEEDAERYYGIRVTLQSIEADESGHVACVDCTELNGAPLGKIYGERICFTGADSGELSYAERQIAIGAAFDLAQRTYGKN